MDHCSANMKQRHLPELESVNRITNIPIVETGWNYAGQLYNRIKKSNNLFFWTFDQAENSFYAVLNTASPAVFLLEGPLSTIDKIICKSLDVFEQRVPSINLPPQMIYFNTKQYVSDVGKQFAKPVLKRADSMKQIGNSVLSSKYTTYAADKLDGALNVADKYMDKYLPPDVTDGPEEVIRPISGPAGKAINTSQHMYLISKKLRRRLTQLTVAEAKVLKEHTAEAVHVLVYVAELIATDPKLALHKGLELWKSLSADEPENQARPENLEQLFVMLTRETARRVIHLVNYTSSGVSKLPQQATRTVTRLGHTFVQLLDNFVKTVHMEGVQQVVMDVAKLRLQRVTVLLKQLNSSANELLEQLAKLLAIQDQSACTSTTQAVASTPKVQAPIPLPAPPTSSVVHNTCNNQQQSNKNNSRSSGGRSAAGSVPRDTLRPPFLAQDQPKANRGHVNNVQVNNGGVAEAGTA